MWAINRATSLLDANAGVPPHAEVLQTLKQRGFGTPEFFAHLGNPASIHYFGRQSRKLLDDARFAIAQSLGLEKPDSDAENLVFTGSGSDANAWVLREFFEKDPTKKTWITTPVEHASVLDWIPRLKTRGVQVHLLSVDMNGIPNQNELRLILEKSFGREVLVSLLWVNNETGVILPEIESWVTLVQTMREASACIHLDGAQAWGKIPVCLTRLGADFVTFSGHKIGGFPGVGVVYRRNTAGNTASSGRQGTENLIGEMVLGLAASRLTSEFVSLYCLKIEKIRDRLESLLFERLKSMNVTFSIQGQAKNTARVVNTTSLTLKTLDGHVVDGRSLVSQLDLRGFSVSAGSACAAGMSAPSHVIQALGATEQEARATLRISLPESIEWEDLERFSEALVDVLKKQRETKRA